MVDLVDEGYGVAVRISQLADSSLVSHHLASTRMVLCASPGYIRARGQPGHPKELALHAAIAYSYWAGRDEWHFHGREGEVSVRIQPVMRANNGDTCMEAALADLGVILEPTFLVGDALRAGTQIGRAHV